MGDLEGDEKNSPAPADDDSFTIRIPRRVLIVAMVGAAVLAAFLLGRGCSNDDPSTPPPSGTQAETEVDSTPDCPDGETVALSVAMELEGRLDPDDVLKDSSGIGLSGDSRFEVVECADVNEDGEPEIIAIARNEALTLGPPLGSWFILDQDFNVLARRTVPDPEVDVTVAGIRESSATYEPAGDGARINAFVETGRREGMVNWAGNEFTYIPDQGSTERTIKVDSEGRVEQIGPFGGFFSSPPLASDGIAQLGTPNTITRYGTESCQLTWYDLGIEILFATFGGGNGCSEGVLQSTYIADDTAHMAGWTGPLTLRVGQTVGQVSAAFPMDPIGSIESFKNYVLVYGPFPYGSNTKGTPTVIGGFVRERLEQIQLWTGAAGD